MSAPVLSPTVTAKPPAPAVRPTGLQRWLQQHCQGGPEISGGVVVTRDDGAEPALAGEWPAAGPLTPALLNAARAAAQRGRPVVIVPTVRLVDSRHNRVLALPIRAAKGASGPAAAAVALAVHAESPADVERLLRELGQACSDLNTIPAANPASAAAASRLDGARLLELQSRLLEHPTLEAAALAFTTELAALLRAERVSLGLQRRSGMEVVAVSNSAEFRPQQTLMQLLAQVMQESADQAERVTYPAPVDEAPRIILAHNRLHQHEGLQLVSLPLVQRGEVVGALVLEWRPQLATGPSDVAWCELLAAAVGPLIGLRRDAERPWRSRLADPWRHAWARLTRPADPLPKVALGTGLLLLLGLTLLPLPYRVSAPARLEGAVQRVVAAPFDGFLNRSLVRPGDVVKAGDVVAELADQDLKLEARKWQSALEQHENAVAAALSRDDRAQFVVSRGKADEARAQLELVRQQLERTRLIAPIDGVVIRGDLGQSLGAPVQRGDALLTLAPAGRHRLVIDVDERDIAAVQPGQTGRLALSSLPTDSLPLVVERITPVASVHDGRNAFEVLARLPEGDATLRPGLQGVAKIEVGEHPLAWIATHRLLDGLRLAGWSWLP